MDTVGLEQLLLCSLVGNAEVGEFQERIKEHWFADEECRQVWRLMRSYYMEHRETIPRDVLHANRPGFQFVLGADSVEGVVNTVRNRWIERSAQDIIDEAEIDYENPELGITTTIAELTTLRATIDSSTGVDIARTIRTARGRYEDRKACGGKIGLEWAWAPLQEATFGAHYGSYTIWYARPKNCKTFVLLYQLIEWKAIYNRKILLINRELSVDQVQDRVICLLAQIDYNDFKRGALSAEAMSCYDAAEEMFESWGNFIVEAIDTDGKEAAIDVDALCEKYGLEEGDVCAIDGMYFYAEGSDWKSMQAFSKGIQKVFRRRKVVGLATTQGNRNQGKNDMDAGQEMGLGDGPIQDCDLAIRVGYNDEEKDITMAIRAVRDGVMASWVIHAKFCTDFTLKYSNAYVPKADEDRAKSVKGVGQKVSHHGTKVAPSIKHLKKRTDENVRSKQAKGKPTKTVRGAKGGKEAPRRTLKARRRAD